MQQAYLLHVHSPCQSSSQCCSCCNSHAASLMHIEGVQHSKRQGQGHSRARQQACQATNAAHACTAATGVDAAMKCPQASILQQHEASRAGH